MDILNVERGWAWPSIGQPALNCKQPNDYICFHVFIALCVGMAVSVYAFGTGGKRKRIFQEIYFSVEEADGMGVIYTKTGEYSPPC